MDLATAARLKRMATHKDDFVKRLTAERRFEHTNKVQKHQEIVESERTLRLQERAAKRYRQREEEVIFILFHSFVLKDFF